MKDNIKKIIIGVIILIVIVVILVVLYITKDSRQLQKYGFSESERDAILKLNEFEQDYFFNHKDLWDIFDVKGYTDEDFSRYIELHKNPFTLSLEQIVTYVQKDYDTWGINFTATTISLIEHDDFKIESAKDYISYRKNNPNAPTEAVIKIVNSNIDEIVPTYDSFILLLLGEDYFIKDNIERYMDYYKKTNLSSKEVVQAVNSNIDYNFYSHTKEANTDLGNLVLVNKYYKLDKDYVPNNLVTTDTKYHDNGLTFEIKEDVYKAFVTLSNDIEKEGMKLKLHSIYRGYTTQQSLYNNYVKRDGKELADTYSARAGYSEHQTGLAIDLTTFDSNFSTFENTNAYTWLQDNAYKYGFILRYPKGKEHITGYSYEPWHYRYVGIDVAKKIKELDITYEEYYAYYIEGKQE